jgi:hypothetical protein
MSAMGPLSGPKWTCYGYRQKSVRDPCVWTGRVLQVRCERWRVLVLRFCIRPVNRAFVLLAIMDIRAHPISF